MCTLNVKWEKPDSKPAQEFKVYADANHAKRKYEDLEKSCASSVTRRQPAEQATQDKLRKCQQTNQIRLNTIAVRKWHARCVQHLEAQHSTFCLA